MDLQRDFYKKVEDVGYLNHVLYSDTDSIYICIPTDINNFTIDQKLDLARKVSVDINNDILSYLFDSFFKRSNIDQQYNTTDFKTEMILDSMMFIPDVKKQYAYKMISEGSEIFDPPRTDYKGIQVVRSDASNLGKRILREVIENIVLNSDIKKKDKIQHIINIINNAHQEFLNLCSEFKLEDVTISSKWGKDKSIINSMMLYNFIIGSNIFLPMSAGRFLYCKFGNIPKLKASGVDLTKINAISIPYNYSSDVLKEKFQEYSITIDTNKQWERVYTTTVQRIVDLVKGEAK